ncbi:class I SAM-dependent methyltransferase [Microbacterium sp. AK031]|uniref:class I SAM-dependent methyltransferase n=1 Tax=Microbacterium sp. AK031 TaxID=2723076 RepID=UPI0021684345|nr:class I SAM-dependent methyltransferase [Microbacterium sp. AK031]MCS3842364.1 SAM-dependent methyltransferase [Microbacterium sp. AK031]
MKAWEGVGEAYAASYASLCAGTHDDLLRRLGAAEGRRLLDVGSGTGTLAARLMGAGWTVTACEPESTMRAVAAREHPRVSLVDGALPSLPFADAAFDAVTANFVLNHVSDPREAARELARVVVPGGVLIATTWVVSPSWFWRSVCQRAGLVATPAGGLAPEKDFERTPAAFGRMMADGGWPSVAVAELSWTWRATTDELWRSAEGGVASAGAFYLSLDAAERGKFARAFDQLCEEHGDGGTVALDHTAAVASAALDERTGAGRTHA